MSRIHFEEVICNACGNTGSFKIYDSINIDDETRTDRFFKRKIIDNSLFLYICPKCGDKFYIEYPFLYNDVKNNFMIWYLPENVTQPEINNVKKVDMRTYNGTLRIAIGKYDFIDKLNVFENKLDDLAIESIKTFTLSKVESSEKRYVNSIMFNGVNEKSRNLEFVFIRDDNSNTMMNVPVEFYGQIKDMLKEKEVKGFEIINQDTYGGFIEND